MRRINKICDEEADRVKKRRSSALSIWDPCFSFKLSNYSTVDMVSSHKTTMEAMRRRHEEEISAAMQEFEKKVAACRVYHEAPDDLFELLVRLFSDVTKYGWGNGGLNNLRLVSKRCMRVVESVATRLTCEEDANTLPIAALKRSKRIQGIMCWGSLRSLEGCPEGLKSLVIRDRHHIQSLEPLSACKELETLEISNDNTIPVQISDLSPRGSLMLHET